MGAKALDHVNIVVADLESAKALFMDLFGFECTLDATLDQEWFARATGLPNAKARCVFLELPEGGTRLEFLEFIEPRAVPQGSLGLNAPGLRHIALEVERIEDVVRQAQEIGLEVISDIATVPREIVPDGKRLAYLTTNEGLIIEVAEFGE